MTRKRTLGVSGYRLQPSNGASLLEPGPATGPCELCESPAWGAPLPGEAIRDAIAAALHDRAVVNMCAACARRAKLSVKEVSMSEPREVKVAMTLADAAALGKMLLEFVREGKPCAVQFINPEGKRIVFQLRENAPKDAKVRGQIPIAEPPPEGSGRP